MRTRSVNEVEEETTFPFCAPKEDNEIKEDDERNFLENIRSRSVNETEDEKLYVLERKNKKGFFVSTRLTFLLFDRWVIFANMEVILNFLTN